jgi:hypothetical protein
LRRITLTITDAMAQALVRLAEAERRRPQDQAAFLLEQRISEGADSVVLRSEAASTYARQSERV